MLRLFRRKKRRPPKEDMDTPYPLYWEDGFSPAHVYQTNSRLNQLKLAERMGLRIPHTVTYEEFLVGPFFPVFLKARSHCNYGCFGSMEELEEATETKPESLMFQEFIGSDQFPGLYFDIRVLVYRHKFRGIQNLSDRYEILAAMVRYTESGSRTNLWRGGQAIPLTGRNRGSELSRREREILEFLQIEPYDRGVPREVEGMLKGSGEVYDGSFMQLIDHTPDTALKGFYGYDFIYGSSMSAPSHSTSDENRWYFLECNPDPGTEILEITGTESPRYI